MDLQCKSVTVRSPGNSQTALEYTDHHGWTELVARKKVADSAAGNAEKRTAGKAVEKPADEHRLNVSGDGTRHQPDQKHGKGEDVHVSPSVELEARRREAHRKLAPCRSTTAEFGNATNLGQRRQDHWANSCRSQTC